MGDKRFGTIILVVGLISFAFFTVMCNVAMYLDQMTGRSYVGLYNYVPKLGVGAILVVLFLGLYYIFREPREWKDK